MLTETRKQETSTAFGWRSLERTAAVALVILLAATAAALRDLEPAALAVGGLVGLGLLRFRSGLVGRLALGALFANVAAWTLLASISNLTHREGWAATAIPSALAVVSLVGVLAVLANLIGRRVGFGNGRAPAIVAAVAVVLIVLANVAGTVASGTSSLVRQGDIVLETHQTRFSQTDLDASAGNIGVVVANKDLFWHTFTIRELDVNLNVPVQADRRIDFEAPPGTYEFICAIPGHPQAGMRGTLSVKQGT